MEISSLRGLETFPLYGDSSLWRLFLVTGTLLYRDFSSLRRLLYIMETFPFGGDCTGALLSGDFSSLRGLFFMETFPLYGGSSLWRLFLFKTVKERKRERVNIV